MPAVDTNVLVRLIARDDPKQAKAAEDFIAGGGWVSLLVLAETTWVLDSVYGLDGTRIADVVEMLLDHKQLQLQDRGVVSAAVAEFRRRPKLGFSDCLLVEIARNAGHLPLGSFDRDLARLEGVTRL